MLAFICENDCIFSYMGNVSFLFWFENNIYVNGDVHTQVNLSDILCKVYIYDNTNLGETLSCTSDPSGTSLILVYHNGNISILSNYNTFLLLLPIIIDNNKLIS